MSRWTYRLIGVFLATSLAGTPELFAAVTGQQPDAGVQQNSQQPDAPFPDSPSASLAQAQTADPVPPPDPQAQPTSSPQQNPTQQSAPAQPNSQTQVNPQPTQTPDASPAPNVPQQNDGQNQKKNSDQQQPVGAAAAQLGRTTGGAASKPAGAAMAPAKQRQSRSLLLKMGLLAAAGIAVGTVVGLTSATPSKPPGAH